MGLTCVEGDRQCNLRCALHTLIRAPVGEVHAVLHWCYPFLCLRLSPGHDVPDPGSDDNAASRVPLRSIAQYSRVFILT